MLLRYIHSVACASHKSCIASCVWLGNDIVSSSADHVKSVDCVMPVGFIVFCLWIDFYIEHRADRVAAETHRSFAEGGVEMMTKGIQLNSILK